MRSIVSREGLADERGKGCLPIGRKNPVPGVVFEFFKMPGVRYPGITESNDHYDLIMEPPGHVASVGMSVAL